MLTVTAGALNIWSYVNRDPNDPYWSSENMQKRAAVGSALAGMGYAASIGGAGRMI